MLKMTTPLAFVCLAGAVYLDAVFEVLAVFTGVLFILAFARR